MKSFLRPIDIEFEDSLQGIHRKYLTFQEEATLAHRQHLEDHIVDQKAANEAIHNTLRKGGLPSSDGCEHISSTGTISDSEIS